MPTLFGDPTLEEQEAPASAGAQVKPPQVTMFGDPVGEEPASPAGYLGARYDVAAASAQASRAPHLAMDPVGSLARGALSEGMYMGMEGAVRGADAAGAAVGDNAARMTAYGPEWTRLNATLGELQRAQAMGASDQRARQIAQVQGRIAQLEAQGAPALAGAMATRPEGVRPVADYIGTAREGVREVFPVSEEFAKSLGGQVLSGIGQALTNIPAYAVGVGPALAFGQMFQAGYDDAKQAGADELTAQKAGLANLPAGFTEMVSDRLQLSRLLKLAKGKLTVGQLSRAVLDSSAGEGATEGVQQVWQNYIANTLVGYKPDRLIDDGVGEAVLVGAIVGGLVAGSGHLAAPRTTPAAGEPAPAGAGPSNLDAEQTPPAAEPTLDPRAQRQADLEAAFVARKPDEAARESGAQAARYKQQLRVGEDMAAQEAAREELQQRIAAGEGRRLLIPLAQAMADEEGWGGVQFGRGRGANTEAPSAEATAAFDSAKKAIGTTDNIAEAGYILPDGKLLDFSGRHYASGYTRQGDRFVAKPGQRDYLANDRQVDHREIEFDGQPDSGGDSMLQFMRYGAIRTGQGLIDVAVRPTSAQEGAIKRVVEINNGAVTLDVKDGERQAGLFFPEGTSPAKVIGTIRRFYAGEKVDSGIRFARGRGAGEMGRENSQLEGFAADLQQKIADRVANAPRTDYAKGDILYTPRGTPVEFVSDLLPVRKGKDEGAQRAYVKFPDGSEGSVLLSNLSPEPPGVQAARRDAEVDLTPLRGKKVTLEAVAGGKVVQAEYDASVAWQDTQKRVRVFEALLKCVGGAA